MIKIIPLPAVISEGITGAQFIKAIEKKNKEALLYQSVEDMLTSDSFNKTVTKGITYHPVIINAADFRENIKRTIPIITKKATGFGCIVPPAEITTILRAKLTNADIIKLGFDWLIPAHKELEDSTGKKLRFIIDSRDENFPLDTYENGSLSVGDIGLIFLAPKKSKK